MTLLKSGRNPDLNKKQNPNKTKKTPREENTKSVERKSRSVERLFQSYHKGSVHADSV
jgi:hypothetical protein